MPLSFQDLHSLADWIASMLSHGDSKVIALDGLDGAGKTTLAKDLVEHFNGAHIAVDDYLNEGQRAYVKFIDLESLKTSVDDALLTSSAVIVDGICALEILRRINVSADIHVYVKQLSSDGSWLRGLRVYREDLSIAEMIEQKHETARNATELPPELGGTSEFLVDRMDIELIQYHYRFKPHKDADVVFERFGG